METNKHEEWEAGFEAHRRRLRLLALRMLGTVAEADDALQEVWLRVSRSETRVENLGGWLTTVTSRVCIDLLRARKARRETLVGLEVEAPARNLATIDPESEALLAEAVGSALLTVLAVLSPAERVSYVLHDLFDMPFTDVAAIVGRSEPAVRQLASRARRRVRGVPSPEADALREREVVRAFLAASREGRFETLLGLLSPDAVFHADETAIGMGAKAAMHGGREIAERVLRAPQADVYALVNDRPALVAMAGGRPRAVLTFTIENGIITAVRLTGDAATIAGFDLVVLKVAPR